MVFKCGVSICLKSNPQGFNVPFSYMADTILISLTYHKSFLHVESCDYERKEVLSILLNMITYNMIT